MRRALLVALLVLLLPVSARAEFTSYAIARVDGTLQIAGRLVRLFGIYIPPTGYTCRTRFSPPECGSRAAIALEFKTANYFVTCREVATLADGSVSAICWVEGEDLGAYLIRQGWALARPEAPFEYAALERIAQQQGVGVWGFHPDSFRFLRRR